MLIGGLNRLFGNHFLISQELFACQWVLCEKPQANLGYMSWNCSCVYKGLHHCNIFGLTVPHGGGDLQSEGGQKTIV